MIELNKLCSIIQLGEKQYITDIPKFHVQNRLLGTLSTVHVKDSYNPQYITTMLQNSIGKILGYETFTMRNGDSYASGTTLEVLPEYRQKGFKFGELLRLSSIMVMIENKIKEFKIYSKNSAIYFHSKYMFEPDINNFSDCNNALQSVIKNSKDKENYQKYYLEAKRILEEINSSDAESLGQDIYPQTNKLIKNYIIKVLENKNEYKKHPFSQGMNMKLSSESIFINKNFFNNLYQQHNIDYKI